MTKDNAARFLRQKIESELGPKRIRPALAEDCHSINDAEIWRGEIVTELTRMISDIQNVGLEEHEIRELNDRINQRLRLKHRWEKRIIDLGGPDYSKVASRIDQMAIQGSGGYKYFGVAKDLPGVREFLASKKAPLEEKGPSRAELFARVDIDYFGIRDEEDATLLEAEAKAEERMRAEAVENWKRERTEKGLSVELPSCAEEVREKGSSK